MKTKLQSRKFWIAILGAALSTASVQLGIDPALALKIAAALLGGYIGTEGLIDAARALDVKEG